MYCKHVKDRLETFILITGTLLGLAVGLSSLLYLLASIEEPTLRLLDFVRWIRWLLYPLPPIFAITILSLYSDYRGEPDLTGWVQMTFRQFKDIYSINPDRWSQDSYSMIYTYNVDQYRMCRNYVHFNFIDWIRVLLWAWSQERARTKDFHRIVEKDRDMQLARMLEVVQSDINAAYEQLTVKGVKND